MKVQVSLVVLEIDSDLLTVLKCWSNLVPVGLTSALIRIKGLRQS